jgi:type I restriction enzyme S subunit
MGYKKTDIGEIPEEWDVLKLGDERIVRQIKAGGTPLRTIKEYYEDGAIPFVRIEDITTAGKYLNNTELKITEDGLRNSNAWLVPERSILYSMYASYGEVVINTIPVATNQAIIAMIPSENIDLEYLYYSLNQIKTTLYKYLRTTTQKNLNAEIVKNLMIPRPPLLEQKRIATILSTVDEAIQKTDEIIGKAEELKRGLMQRLLTRGIGHTKFKQTDIGEIPEDWEVSRLEDVLLLCQYGLSVPLFETGARPIFRMNNFENGYVIPNDIKYANIDDATFNQFKLNRGDILFNRTNSYDLVGKVGIFLLDGDYTFASYLIRLRTDPSKADPFFLNYYMNVESSQNSLRSLATRGSSQSNINATNLKSMLIPLPSLAEQRKIASVISSVDGKLAVESRRRDRLDHLKRGLMQVLLTGRVRVA